MILGFRTGRVYLSGRVPRPKLLLNADSNFSNECRCLEAVSRLLESTFTRQPATYQSTP